MKKLFTGLLLACLVLTGCGGSGAGDPENKISTGQRQTVLQRTKKILETPGINFQVKMTFCKKAYEPAANDRKMVWKLSQDERKAIDHIMYDGESDREFATYRYIPSGEQYKGYYKLDGKWKKMDYSKRPDETYYVNPPHWMNLLQSGRASTDNGVLTVEGTLPTETIHGDFAFLYFYAERILRNPRIFPSKDAVNYRVKVDEKTGMLQSIRLELPASDPDGRDGFPYNGILVEMKEFSVGDVETKKPPVGG